MTVDEQLDLPAAYTQGDPVPSAIGQTKRERLHVDAAVPAWYVMQSKFVFTAAALQLQISGYTLENKIFQGDNNFNKFFSIIYEIIKSFDSISGYTLENKIFQGDN